MEQIRVRSPGENIAAVVVTYNRKELLERCIYHILAQDHPCDVLIVDNASTDGTADMVRSFTDSRVHYQSTGANLGGAGGFHYGMKWAAEQGYEYLWIMDDDCLPDKDALKVFWDAHLQLNGNYGWLSSKVIWTDGSICHMNVQRATPFKKVTDFNGPLSSVVAASFVSLFVPVKHIRNYGLPIKDFFIWADDLEYTRRISMGEKCYLVPRSQVVHAMKSNVDSNIVHATGERIKRYSYSYRNEVFLYRREGLLGWIWILTKYTYHTLQVLCSNTENKMYRIGIIWKGFCRGIRFHPSIEFLCLDQG